jgi:hypothetical protein
MQVNFFSHVKLKSPVTDDILIIVIETSGSCSTDYRASGTRLLHTKQAEVMTTDKAVTGRVR